tara:strand:- start:292 stop:1227 length:936 start_codon:yes stop_codon:yes gene_type:complete
MVFPFTLQQLDYVNAIAITKNFKVAAEEILFISQPALSNQIKKLERDLGILIFDRSNKKVTLTESGQLFLEYAKRIIAMSEETTRALRDLKLGERGTLTIGASQTIGTYLMPRILALFAKQYPQIHLNVQVYSTRAISQNLVNRQIDIAVVGGDIPPQFKNQIETEEFLEDELVLIISTSHPFASVNENIIEKEHLYHLNFISLDLNSTIKNFIETTLFQNGIDACEFKTIMQLNSIEAIKTAVSLGLGVAFVSVSAIEQELLLKKVKILRIKGVKIKRKLYILTNPQCSRSQSFEYFYEKLIQLKSVNED